MSIVKEDDERTEKYANALKILAITTSEWNGSRKAKAGRRKDMNGLNREDRMSGRCMQNGRMAIEGRGVTN